MAGPLDGELISGGKSNLTFAVTDGVSRWVVRRPPASGLTPSAHDVAREWRVTHALRGSAVPVAPAVAHVRGRPVLGCAVRGDASTCTARSSGRRSQLDGPPGGRARGLRPRAGAGARRPALGRPRRGRARRAGRPDGFLERQVRLWWRQWTEVKSEDLADATRLQRRARRVAAVDAGSDRDRARGLPDRQHLLAVDDIIEGAGGRRLGARDGRRRARPTSP